MKEYYSTQRSLCLFNYRAQSQPGSRHFTISSKAPFPFQYKARSIPSKRPIPIPLQSSFPFHYKAHSIFTRPIPCSQLICTSKANSHSRSMSNQCAVPTKPQLSHHLPPLSSVLPQATPTPKHPVRCHSYDTITK